MERRFNPYARCEVRTAGGKPVITGLASVFFDGTSRTEFQLWPGAVERVDPGAFDKVLSASDSDPRGLFNHDPNMLLGRKSAGSLKLTRTKAGLQYEIKPPDTTTARDVLANIRAGNVTGSSFSFTIARENWTTIGGNEVRTILEVGKLYDVGPVTFPAYEASTVDLSLARSSYSRRYGCEPLQAILRRYQQRADQVTRSRRTALRRYTSGSDDEIVRVARLQAAQRRGW